MKRSNWSLATHVIGFVVGGACLQCTGSAPAANPDAGSIGGASGVGGSSNAGGSTNAGGTSTQAGATSSGGAAASGTGGSGGMSDSRMNFFVSSDTSTTANLGGLQGADARCQRLATAVGFGNRTWVAYLSAESPVTNARDRIGNGPYYNSQGALLAADKTELHARSGDPALFIDEHGNRINGQWAGSPTPNEHDILTGSTSDGMLNTGTTCQNWTGTTGSSFVGHTDGLGPSMNPAPPYNSWNSSHTGQCGNTAPGGGAGRIYCFTVD